MDHGMHDLREAKNLLAKAVNDISYVNGIGIGRGKTLVVNLEHKLEQWDTIPASINGFRVTTKVIGKIGKQEN